MAVRLALRWFSHCRVVASEQSSQCVPSSSADARNLERFLPSQIFVKQHIKRPSHREKLASLLSEINIFLEMFGNKSLPEFSDGLWATYFSMWSPGDRCAFLNDLRLERKRSATIGTAVEKHQISVINQKREDNGEIVYAPGFNSLIELRGQTFRRMIDKVYGSRLLSSQRSEEDLPKLVVDCRFLSEYSAAVQSSFARQIQALHDNNWVSRQPFSISLANFRPDNQLAEIVKRHFLFHYGPPSSPSLFSRHPFAPVLTSKSVREVSESETSDIMYISWRATQFLPEVPVPNTRAVVLCASNDFQPWSSSISAAQKDSIKAYRLPLEKHVRFENMSKFLP